MKEFKIEFKEKLGSSYYYFEAEENNMHSIACERVNKEVLEKMKTDKDYQWSPFYSPIVLPKNVLVREYNSVLNKYQRNGIKFKLNIRRTEFNSISGKFYVYSDKA